MKNDIFSNHIGNASELTVIAKIKKGFVAVPQPLTYANRLRVHLRMLSALRRSGLETDRAGLYSGPIDSLQTLQFVRWTLIENDTKMLLSVNFDRAFEPYIRRIVQAAGPLLDSILCNCEDFDGHASDNGFDAFMSYAQTHQVPVELFAAASPNFSVDDADYFLEFDKKFRGGIGHENAGNWHPSLSLTTPQQKREEAYAANPVAVFEQGFRIIRVMAENAWRFARHDQDLNPTFDDFIYHRLTQTLVPSFWRGLVGWAAKNGLDPDGTNPDSPASLVGFVLNFPSTVRNNNPTDAQIHVASLFEVFRDPLLWFAKRPDGPANPSLITHAKGMIQGGLLPAKDASAPVDVPQAEMKATHACMLLFRVDDPASGAAFLAQMGTKLWPSTPLTPAAHPTGQLLYNLSISHSGLKALEIPETDRQSFPSAFREGMARRAGLLGDTEINHPEDWEWPVCNWPLDANSSHAVAPTSIDIMVQIEAALDGVTDVFTFDDQHPLLAEVQYLAGQSGVQLLAVEPMQRRTQTFGKSAKPQTTGHLGFVDGKSQPVYGPHGAPERTPYGDLLLGHQDTLSGTRPYKQETDLLRDGTFQVVRKMQLDVPAFHTHSATDQAKMVGRNMDGTTLSGDAHYADDADGKKCPLQSHVRRTNPVKTVPPQEATPRILRRGFSYGPFIDDYQIPDHIDRGLFFIAYNANIAEQFEIIQRWITGGNSTGISSWQGDPLLAPKRPGAIRNFRYLDDQENVVSVNLPDRPIAKLQWGLYAFVPSKLGLETLIGQVGKGANPVSNDAGLPKIMQAPIAIDAEAQRQEWKQLLEDPDEAKTAQRDAIWAKIREDGGVHDTASTYGTLVGGAQAVADILNDETGTHSVCEYLTRMQTSIGWQYLGLDGGDTYDKDSAAFNAFLNNFDAPGLFNEAMAQAYTVLKAIPVERQTGPTSFQPIGRRCNVIAFIFQTLAELSVTWFGVPRDDFQIGGPVGATNKPHCPMDFLASSFYVFGPHPTNHVTRLAQHRSPKAVQAIKPAASGTAINGGKTLLNTLLHQKSDSYWDDDKIAEMVAGGAFGFLGPVSGSLRSVMYDWIKEGTLWRLQQRYNAALQTTSPDQAAHDVLRPAILKSMGKRPIPDLIYRTRKSETKPDERIVISLKSAIDDTQGDNTNLEYFLFAGDVDDKTTTGPRHKCPGKLMGLSTMMGCVAALFQFSQLREEGPLTLWLHQ